jgi:hypothetical protein
VLAQLLPKNASKYHPRAEQQDARWFRDSRRTHSPDTGSIPDDSVADAARTGALGSGHLQACPHRCIVDCIAVQRLRPISAIYFGDVRKFLYFSIMFKESQGEPWAFWPCGLSGLPSKREPACGRYPRTRLRKSRELTCPDSAFSIRGFSGL